MASDKMGNSLAGSMLDQEGEMLICIVPSEDAQAAVQEVKAAGHTADVDDLVLNDGTSIQQENEGE